MSRTFVLQDWVTIRGAAVLASFTQDEERWLDLDGYADAMCWIDVAEVTPPNGTSTNYLTFSIETAATCDDSYFTAMTPPLLYGSAAPFNLASTVPLVSRSIRSAATSNLMRYVRWKITPSTGALWDLTFRVRVVATRSTAFSPIDLSGCMFWVRADLGVTIPPTAITVSAWADQSGNGLNASQATPAAQPPYVVNAMNGLPAIQGDGSARYMSTAAFNLGPNATIFAAVQPSASPQGSYTRIVEHLYSNSYYLGTDTTGAKYKLIIANATPPYGAAEAGTVSANINTIVSGTYPSPSPSTGALYVNGKRVASDTFTPSTVSNPLGIMTNTVNFAGEFWNGYVAEIIIYNRALSASELTRVHRYLGARYNIAVP